MARSELLLFGPDDDTDNPHVADLRAHGFGVHSCQDSIMAAQVLDTRPIIAILIQSSAKPREIDAFLTYRRQRYGLIPVFFVSLTEFPNLKRLLDHPRILVLPSQPSATEVERLLISIGAFCRPAWQQYKRVPPDMKLKIEDPEFPISFKNARAEFEKRFLVRAFQIFKGNLTRTADAVGMARRNLQVKVQNYDIDIDAIRDKYGTF